MNIADLKQSIEQDNEGAVIPIYQRNGDPYLSSDGKPATITVLGAESKVYRDAKRAQTRRAFKRARLGSRDITPEEIEADAIRLAAAAVIDWYGWEDNGKPLPCKPENVQMLLGIDHIFEQVNAGIQAHSGFFVSGSGD